MNLAPVAVGLILCDNDSVDLETRQYCLDGLWHSVFVTGFPSRPRPMLVYAALTGGYGEGVLKVEIREPVGLENRLIYRKSHWLHFPDNRLYIAHSIFRLASVTFFRSGLHFVQMWFEERLVTERRFEVIVEN